MEQIEEFVKFRSLEYLNLKSIKCTALVTESLCSALRVTQLSRLELINVPFLNLSEQFALLLESVANWRDLKHLSLAQNTFNQAQLCEICEAIVETCRLETLDLSFNSMRVFFEEHEAVVDEKGGGKKKRGKIIFGRSPSVVGFYEAIEEIINLGVHVLKLS